MGYSDSDAAQDAWDADRGAADLDAAEAAARSIAETFTHEHRSDPLAPAVTAELTAGAEDQPLFVFSLLFELADDFDASDYPADEIAASEAALRTVVESSVVDHWEWIVMTGTKTGFASA
jgi:hypothetical protein